MKEQNNIRYLKQEEIDKKAWDLCIDSASNGLIYGYSIYLDHMATHWDGLVLGNYKQVMPLPWRKKAGIYYLYQPFLTAQLGIFGNGIDEGLLESFLAAIPRKFRLWEFSLNQQNIFNLPGYHLYERSNYILPLKRPYEELYAQYRDNIKRNIRKATQYGCTLQTETKAEDIAALVLQQDEQLSETELTSFVHLYHQLKKEGKARAYGMVSRQGQLLASAVFLFSHKRAYYILVGNHPNGRTLGASHALIDAFIRDHSGKDLMLDFEGSDIRNLAFFYRGFGAVEEKYAAIRLDRLPFYLTWIKKS